MSERQCVSDSPPPAGQNNRLFYLKSIGNLQGGKIKITITASGRAL